MEIAMNEIIAALLVGIDGRLNEVSGLIRVLRLRQTPLIANGLMKDYLLSREGTPDGLLNTATRLAEAAKQEIQNIAALVERVGQTAPGAAADVSEDLDAACVSVKALCEEFEGATGTSMRIGVYPPADNALDCMFNSFMAYLESVIKLAETLLHKAIYDMRFAGASPAVIQLARIVNVLNKYLSPHQCSAHCYTCSEVPRLRTELDKALAAVSEEMVGTGVPSESWWQANGLVYAAPGTRRKYYEKDDDVAYWRVLQQCGDRA
jgi:hypothetical protein